MPPPQLTLINRSSVRVYDRHFETKHPNIALKTLETIGCAFNNTHV